MDDIAEKDDSNHMNDVSNEIIPMELNSAQSNQPMHLSLILFYIFPSLTSIFWWQFF